MPKLYRRKARTDRYKIGLSIPSDNRKGFVIDYSQESTSRPDQLICKKGELYYTWHPKGSSWQFSRTKPDLRSEWEKTIEDFQERVEQLSEDLDLDRAELSCEVEEVRDELQERLNNIPEQLQESSVLNERIEELEALIDLIEKME